MDTPQSPTEHLLAALPRAEFEHIAPHLELVAMPLGEVLYESGGQLQYVYFPTTRHRVPALRDGERRIVRNRGGGQ